MKNEVDEYVSITRQIKQLELRQAELASLIKAKGAGRYEGTLMAAVVTSVAGRKSTDWAAVCAYANIPPEVVAKYTTKGDDTFRLALAL